MTYMETKLFPWQKTKQIITLLFCQGRYCILRRKNFGVFCCCRVSKFDVIKTDNKIGQNVIRMKPTLKLRSAKTHKIEESSACIKC